MLGCVHAVSEEYNNISKTCNFLKECKEIKEIEIETGSEYEEIVDFENPWIKK